MFEEKPVNAKNECLGEPCAYCDVEWCSIACFKRRGYEWDSFHRFIKGSDNKPLRRNIVKKQDLIERKEPNMEK